MTAPRAWLLTEWRRIKLPAPKVGFAGRRRLDWAGQTARGARRDCWRDWHSWREWISAPRLRRFCHAKFWPTRRARDEWCRDCECFYEMALDEHDPGAYPGPDPDCACGCHS